ncbi:PAS domain S-box protein [Emcibacter sp. SYSU 3D8]|uniref:PAS domain S-box protein n=1 Tax=Emcibacter sp. SYSU 3D8 TaxID=3133969 RepID=UPI0031FF3D1A
MSADPRLPWSMPASPEMWRLFLQHMPACVAVLDRDMRYVATSERWIEDLELTGRDIIGQSHYDLFPGLDDTRRERHRRCLAGETIRLGLDDYVLPSGARLTVKWEYVPWHDAQGDIAGMIMFSEVMTRQRMLEEKVEAEADRLHRAEIVSKSGAWEWDVAANVVTWSAGLSALLGLDDVRADGERPSWTRLVHPDDRDGVMKQVGRALAGEIPYDIEMRMLRDDGTILDVRVIAEISRDPEGNPLSVFGAMQDVTELRRKERELSAVYRRYRLASEVSGTAAWEIWPKEGRVLTDENFMRLIGRAGEPPSETLDDLQAAFPPETRAKLTRMIGEIVAGNRSTYDLTLRTRLPDGKTIWLSAYGKVLGGRKGEPLRIVGTTRDVTDLKLADLALQNSERNLLVAQQIASVGSWEWDVGSETLNCSPELLRIYGYPTTRTSIRLEDLMSRIHPDDAERVTVGFGELRSGGAVNVESEMRLVRPGQGTIWIRAIARGFTNDAGRLVRMNGAVEDITARKVADREIALRDSALQNSVGAVAMAGMDGYFVYANQAFLDLLGIESQEALKKVNALETVRDPAAAEAAFGALVNEPYRWDGELPIRRTSGEHRDVLVTAAVHRAVGEEPLIIASYMDVTERNAALRDLARSERQLRQAQTMARLGETAYDTVTGRYAMPAHTREILGLGDEYATFDAAMGRKLIHPDDWKKIDDGARLLIKGLSDSDMTTYRFLSPTRGTLHVQTINHAERDETGRVTGMTGIIQDVTHIKQAEDEAREARRRAERYLDIAGSVIIALDPDGHINLINRQGRELLGYSESELIGRDWYDLAVPAELHDELRARVNIMADERSQGFRVRESEVVTRTGERRLIEWVTSLLYDDDDNFAGWLSSGRDLTDLRQAEQSLRDSEVRTRAVMEAASIGIVTLDETGCMVSLNPEAENIFGMEETLLLGRNLADMFAPSERESCDAMRLPVDEDEAGGHKAGLGVLHEFTVPRGEGEATPVEMSVTAMDIGGRRTFVAAIQDITERKRAEAKLQQVQRLETIGQLTGGVAHDFNNLLMAMQVNLELLKEMVEHDPDGNEYADAALSSVARGAELTRRLLAFSRRQPLQPKVIDINGLVTETVRILQRTLGEQIAIVSVLEPDIWPVEVDRAQLENVLMNLAVNARDAMPSGGRITIETVNSVLDEHYAVTHGDVEPGEYVMLAVSDTGTGMSPQVLARAFEPFFTTKDVGRGSGLGLSMTYGFVKQSGGHLKLYSELGVGTTIKIYFRRDRRGVQVEKARTAEPVAQTGNEVILLIEDDASVRQTVTALLQSLGYTVVVASDGPEALELVEGGVKPDLLLADIVLPKGLTGRQVCDAIGARLPGIKTLYMSGYTENAIVHQGRLEDGVVLLSKPFPRRHLAEKLREVLDS